MNQVNLSLAPTPSWGPLESAAGAVAADSAAIAGETILQFSDGAFLARLLTPPVLPPVALGPMQQLVELMTQLRSPAHGWTAKQPPTPEALAPYASEEVEAVVQGLAAADMAAVYAAIAALPDAPTAAAIAPVHVSTEALMPLLLWNLARTAYPVMQLLEGIEVMTQAAGQPQPSPGMLRLVPVLQLETATATWALDVVTGAPPQPLGDRSVLLHSDTAPHLASYLEPDLLAVSLDPEAANWVDLQLQSLTQAILAVSPTLHPWLHGFAVQSLVPGSSWSLGQLQLRLDFALSAPEEIAGSSAHAPVEAELVDELAPASAFPALVPPRDRVALPQVAVVEVAPSPPVLTTMIRLAQPATLHALLQRATRHEIEQGLGQILRSPAAIAASLEPHILQEAYRIAALTGPTISTNWSLLQPELVGDELMPKLLWQVARSAYHVMCWLGGRAATVLQPGQEWTVGTVRLVIVLAIALDTAPDTEAWALDLATGQFLPPTGWQMAPGTIIRLTEPQSLGEPAPPLLESVTLATELEQRLQTQAPEVAALMTETAIAGLTPDHDWQPGTLRINTGLEFIPHHLPH